ncbi:dehydratase [Rhodococcus sp. Leaf7]|uniref:fused (3R)-hydroxyacyl-ACP dehydratase subunits HadA/HadB n=1 Tax=unclassified Rhodococcus (in: high G+C Gram-positive bacteria) TaxID=192944 RepID=UPI0007006A50|nr:MULTISPECIES: fused (3R)-hydroxyacyl-ACP dehydratase subunits HadA/HadB [unclassified Rhodococcus (in: high G+C Gram-positive bacteria)]KQU02819.1 dehydratase [Rhodococcus sp. Leaf7]KQU38617.1 dehydratase [Rhodococcus sp. Leaf247]
MTAETLASDAVATDAAFDPSQHALDMVGYHYRMDDYYEVGREKVREYAKAVRDFHPVHWTEEGAREHGYDALMAPPTFFSLVGIIAQQKLLERIATGYDLSRMLQTDQHAEYYAPVLAGDRLVCDVSLDSFRKVVGRDMMVTKTVITNQRNELAQITYTTLLIGRADDGDNSIADVARGMVMNGMFTFPAASSDPEGVNPSGDDLETVFDPPVLVPNRGHARQRFENVSVGDALPTRTIDLSRGDLINYAGVVGDNNPVHWSDHFASLLDLDTVVAHGMLTMGLGTGFVSAWLGDPGALKECTVRFTSPVMVPPIEHATIVVNGVVKSMDADARTAEVSIDARYNGKRILGHKAKAIVYLA